MRGSQASKTEKVTDLEIQETKGEMSQDQTNQAKNRWAFDGEQPNV
jgi:hypothetical protein